MPTSKGFTIVELLITIVVIAILAAISIVAYQGIQSRAERSSNASAVRAYVQSLRLYKADTGSLPNIRLCFGPAGSYSDNTCALAGQNGTVDSTWNTTLSNYGLSTQPAVKKGNTHTIVEFSPSFYSQPALLWTIDPSHDCDVPNVMSQSGGVWGVYGAAYSQRFTSQTNCYVSLANI